MRTIRNANVAVVGGAGFLGSHLTNHLIDDRDCRVLVVDNLVAGRREFIHPKAEFHHADICGSEEHLRKLFADFAHANDPPGLANLDYGPKQFYVMNYAAYPYIPVSFKRPIHVADVNFMGAMKVINAAQEARADGILQVSSAEIYGEGFVSHDVHEGGDERGGRISEDNLALPHSTYGCAKLAVDCFCQCAWKERQTPVIALRQFNACGPRETHSYIVPEIISQLARWQDGERETRGRPRSGYWDSSPVVKLGNNSFRDFIYAGDAVRIAVELLERGAWGEVYNLGSESGIKMYDLAKLIGKVMGFADVVVETDEARVRPWEIWTLLADVSKIKRVIHTWPQLVTLEEALRRTVEDFEQSGRKWCWEK